MHMKNVASKAASPLCNNDMEAGRTRSAQDFLVSDMIGGSDLENLPKPPMGEDVELMGSFPSHVPRLTGVYCSWNHDGGVEPQLDLQRDSCRCPDVS